ALSLVGRGFCLAVGARRAYLSFGLGAFDVLVTAAACMRDIAGREVWLDRIPEDWRPAVLIAWLLAIALSYLLTLSLVRQLAFALRDLPLADRAGRVVGWSLLLL